MHHDPLLVRMEIERFLAANPILEDDDMLRADMLEGCTSFHEASREAVRKVLELQALVAGLDLWRDTLKQRLDRFELGIEGWRGVLFKLMQAANVRSLVLPEATLSVGTGPPKVIITDEAKVPDIMCRIVREPMKNKIRQAIKDGETVPGAVLSNGEDRLTIRTK